MTQHPPEPQRLTGIRAKFHFTQSAISQGQPDVYAQDEDLSLGYAYLRALANSGQTLVEVEPNVWRVFVEGLSA